MILCCTVVCLGVDCFMLYVHGLIDGVLRLFAVVVTGFASLRCPLICLVSARV